MNSTVKRCLARRVAKLSRSMTLIKPLDLNLEHSMKMYQTTQRPNHKTVIVIGGGQSGSLIMNRLNRNGGFDNVMSTLIDKRAHMWVHEGLDLFPYDIMEAADVRRPTLGRIQDLCPMLIEEVIHFDPANNYLGTYDGTEMTYDYCVLATGLDTDVGSVKDLEYALYDKYSQVVTTLDYDQALRMKERLEFCKGKELVVYCAGDQGNDFTRPVNHALLLRDKFPTASLVFFLNGESISSNPEVDRTILDLFKQKNIVVEQRMKLTEINSEHSATFETAFGEPKSIDFDLMYFDPHLKEPKFLTDAGVRRSDFDSGSFQHRQLPQLFGFGSYIMKDNSIPGLLEQSHTLNLNMLLQMVHDYSINDIDSDREVRLRDYQKYRLFPSHSTLLKIETSDHEGFTRVGKASKLDFYKLAYSRYDSFFKGSKNGTNFGRLGKYIPTINDKKSWVHKIERTISIPGAGSK